MVCVGTGIDCDSDHTVLTTLNQCLQHGDVLCGAKNLPAAAVAAGERHLTGPLWVWHDHIGYILPESANLDLKTGPQRGSWSDIGVGSAEVITNDVFNLAIDHGNHLKDGHYRYLVRLGVEAAEMPALDAESSIRVLCNSADLQAAADDATHQISAAFYTPGTLQAGPLTLDVDQPCLLLFHHRAHPSRWSLRIQIAPPQP